MAFHKYCFLFPAFALFLGGSVASADTIGGLGNPCCEGAAYTLSYSGSPIASTATTQTFQITLDVDDSSYNGGGSFLKAVAIKVAPPPDVISASLVSAPLNFQYKPNTGLNGQGCSASGGGFLCVQASGNGAPVSGGPYDFTYDVMVKTGTLFSAADGVTIKALYVNQDGRGVGGLLGQNITLSTTATPQSTATPEPASMFMLASGLAAVGVLSRKRNVNKTK